MKFLFLEHLSALYCISPDRSVTAYTKLIRNRSFEQIVLCREVLTISSNTAGCCYVINHKNYNLLDCVCFKKLLFFH